MEHVLKLNPLLNQQLVFLTFMAVEVRLFASTVSPHGLVELLARKSVFIAGAQSGLIMFWIWTQHPEEMAVLSRGSPNSSF